MLHILPVVFCKTTSDVHLSRSCVLEVTSFSFFSGSTRKSSNFWNEASVVYRVFLRMIPFKQRGVRWFWGIEISHSLWLQHIWKYDRIGAIPWQRQISFPLFFSPDQQFPLEAFLAKSEERFENSLEKHFRHPTPPMFTNIKNVLRVLSLRFNSISWQTSWLLAIIITLLTIIFLASQSCISW